MVKPKEGYAKDKFIDQVAIPEGWSTEDRLNMLRKRRAFFEVELLDWVVKYDLLGDGKIIKTIKNRGVGFDRPEQFDELKLSLKVYQQNTLLI